MNAASGVVPDIKNFAVSVVVRAVKSRKGLAVSANIT